MTNKEFYFDSRDGETKIYAKTWEPDDKPKMIVQIVHGMAEYVNRYDLFARYLAERGILVVGDDHLGHGKSIKEGGRQGYFCKNDPATVVVRDEHRLKKTMQEKYPDVPYVILGHSMGSFITRNYLCRYGSGIQGAIIMGTGNQPKALLAVSRCLVKIQKLFLGDTHVAKFIDKLAFGSYCAKIENPRTNFDWLSQNSQNVDLYMDDPDCGFIFTVNGFETLFQLLWNLTDKKYIQKMPKTLPVFFVAGDHDPVGNYGKGVEEVYESFKSIGMEDVEMKLYDGYRHEILNEIDKEIVYEDIYKWLIKHIK